MKYIEASEYKPFEYINKDLDLLLILTFIDAYKEKKDLLHFGDFFKGEYWSVDDVKEEIIDYHEYQAIADMALEQLVFIIEQLRLGSVVEVGVDNTEKAVEDLLIEVANVGPKHIKEQLSYFAYIIEHIYFLDWQERGIREAKAEQDPKNYKEILRHDDKSIFFPNNEHGYFRALQPIAASLPSRIVIQVHYNDKNILKIEKEIASYLGRLSRDELIEDLSQYQPKRLYFSQQIENFCRYLNRQQLVGNSINIPFTILTETDFEAVKILAYLQQNNIINMRWSDEGSWKVQFNRIPITPDSLINPEKSQIITDVQPRLKTGLSFDEAKAMLVVGDKSIKIRKGTDQYHLLRIMFASKKDLPQEWFYSDIAEQYDHSASFKDKKFSNAAYQVKQKIIRDTGLKDVFLTTAQSVRINPEYLRKS